MQTNDIHNDAGMAVAETINILEKDNERLRVINCQFEERCKSQRTSLSAF